MKGLALPWNIRAYIRKKTSIEKFQSKWAIWKREGL